MAETEKQRYKAWLATLDAAEFENEFWTLRNERRFLDSLTDGQVLDRISWCETESHRRIYGQPCPRCNGTGTLFANANPSVRVACMECAA